MRQIVRHRPDAGEEWNEVRVRIGECELDGLRRGRRLSPQERGTEIEKSDDEFSTIVQCRGLDEFNLNAYSLFGSENSLMDTMAIRELDLRGMKLPTKKKP